MPGFSGDRMDAAVPSGRVAHEISKMLVNPFPIVRQGDSAGQKIAKNYTSSQKFCTLKRIGSEGNAEW